MHDINDYFLDILNSIGEEVFWKDKNGVYLGCNKYSAELLGLKDPKDMIGKTDYDVFPKAVADRLRQHDKIVMETGRKIVFEEKVTASTGKKLIHLTSKSPLYDKKGNIIGIIGNATDITDRKKAEQLNIEKLQAEKEMAEKVSNTVELISENIAHEIRTPLSIISINVDRLQAELKKILFAHHNIEQTNKIKSFADNIKSAVKNGSSIITMLLTKLHGIFDVKHAGIELKPNSIKQSIDDAIKEYPFYKNENRLIVWSEQKNQDFIYLGDNLLTKHVLFNLIKNALRAIKEAKHGEIFISLDSDNKFNYLIFKDTATGIPAENLDSLFKQFHIKNKGSSGLGLAFCKMTMQSYGGDIICDSKKDEFTVFTLSFPKITDNEKDIAQ